MNDTLYTAAQIAAAAGISKTAVRKAIAARSIEPAQIYGQAMLYAAEDAETIIKAAQARQEFTENHREPARTNHREPPQTAENPEQAIKPEIVDKPGEAAEGTTENQPPETTENRRTLPGTTAHPQQLDLSAAYRQHLEDEVAYLRQALDDANARADREAHRAEAAEQRCGILIARTLQQAELLEAARDAAAKPIKAKRQPGPFLAKLRSIFFEERR